MTKPQDETKPKYMCMEGKTQFEMAMAIDDAMTAAELSMQGFALPSALQWWFQQFELQVQEDFQLGELPGSTPVLATQKQFIKACLSVYSQVLSNAKDSNATEQALEGLFKNSLIDALDMMRAQGLWRFDVQRVLQDLQGRVMDECRHASRKA